MANEQTLEGIVIQAPKAMQLDTENEYYETVLMRTNGFKANCYGHLPYGILPYDFISYLKVIKLNENLERLNKSYSFQHPILIIGKLDAHPASNFFIHKVELIPNGGGRLSLTSTKNKMGGLSLTEEEKKEK